MDVLTAFRTNLRKVRVAMRLTQEDLAHDAKTSSSVLSNIENGNAVPSLDTMDRLAKALGVKLQHLLAERIVITILSDDSIEIGLLPARPPLTLARQPARRMGRPRKRD